MITPQRLKLVQQAMADYEAAKGKTGGTLEAWIQFRFACSKETAARLILAARQGIPTAALRRQQGRRR